MQLIGVEKLTNKSEKVYNITDIAGKDISIINNMINVCKENNGIAIAAPQVGIFKRFFVSLIDLINLNKSPTLYINPSYKPTNNYKKNEILEGCISYNNGKDKYIMNRYNPIKATWYYFSEGKLNKVEEILEGDGAIIFQHETDHLDGITIANEGEKHVVKPFENN